MEIFTKASDYIKKYRLKCNFNDFTKEFTYEREITLKDKIVHLQILEDEADTTKCLLFIGTFYPNKWDSKAQCYGKFGKPRFVENLKNDILDYETKTSGREQNVDGRNF